MPPTSLCWSVTSEAVVGGIAGEVEPSHQCPITFCCHSSHGSRREVKQNGIWYGSEEKVCHWIFPCGKKWCPVTFIDSCWTLTETRQWMWGQWSSGWCVSGVARRTRRILDSRAQQSHLQVRSTLVTSSNKPADYEQETVYRAEYQFQSFGNYSYNTGISQSLPVYKCSPRSRKHTVCKFVETYWTKMRLKMTVLCFTS